MTIFCADLTLAVGGSVTARAAQHRQRNLRKDGRERGSQDSNLESPVLETGALASWATAPEGVIVTSDGPGWSRAVALRGEGLEPPRAEAPQDLNRPFELLMVARDWLERNRPAVVKRGPAQIGTTNGTTGRLAPYPRPRESSASRPAGLVALVNCGPRNRGRT